MTPHDLIVLKLSRCRWLAFACAVTLVPVAIGLGATEYACFSLLPAFGMFALVTYRLLGIRCPACRENLGMVGETGIIGEKVLLLSSCPRCGLNLHSPFAPEPLK
jgi:hypothetical protein